MNKRYYQKRSPLTAQQARMKQWGYIGNNIDQNLSDIYTMIDKHASKEYTSKVVYHHNDGDQAQQRILKVLREGGYQVIGGYEKKNSRYVIEINW